MREPEAAIEEPGPVPYLSTAGDCLRVASRETKPVQQKQGVCGRGPLWAVESIRPTPVVGLGREQAGTPALDANLGSFGVDLVLRGTHEISKDLPADRRVALEQPPQHSCVVLVGPGYPPAATGRVHVLIVASLTDFQ